MEQSTNYKYDLKFGQDSETVLGKILEAKGKTVEVKSDRITDTTGNVFVEYGLKGRPSGISTSEAVWYAFSIYDDEVIIIIETKRLKKMCREYLGTWRDRMGGDNKASNGILLPIERLIDKK